MNHLPPSPVLALLGTTDSVTAVLAGAVATTQPTYAALGENLHNVGSLNGVTPVTLVSAPSSGLLPVQHASIFNGDTAAVTVTIKKVVSGTGYTLAKVTLGVGSTAHVDGSGVKVVDSNGQLAQSITDTTGVGAAAGTGVVATEYGNGGFRKTVLTLTNAAVVLADEAAVVAYGGLKVYDFPAGAIQVLGAVLDLDLTKSSAGVNADWDGDVGLGTVTASNNATLSGTEQDLVPTTATPQAAAGATTANAQSTITQAGIVLDGTTTAADVYLNLLVDDTDHNVAGTPCNLIANGTITIHWLNLGDY